MQLRRRPWSAQAVRKSPLLPLPNRPAAAPPPGARGKTHPTYLVYPNAHSCGSCVKCQSDFGLCASILISFNTLDLFTYFCLFIYLFFFFFCPCSRPVSARTKASSPGDKDVESSLNEEIAALQATVEGLEKERDFYFGTISV